MDRSWFQGASTVQVTNAMGYAAAAIGNHEFDFGQAVLRTNKKAAKFPFISANLIDKKTGKPPDYCLPYVIREVNGVRVAVIGLTTRQIPGIVVPDNIAGLAFSDYAEALRRAVPQALAEGAELPVVIAQRIGRIIVCFESHLLSSNSRLSREDVPGHFAGNSGCDGSTGLEQ